MHVYYYKPTTSLTVKKMAKINEILMKKASLGLYKNLDMRIYIRSKYQYDLYLSLIRHRTTGIR